MATWETNNGGGDWEATGDSSNHHWNDSVEDNTWKDNPDGNGAGPAASFEKDEMNSDNLAGDDGAKNGHTGCFGCGQEG